jgi:hypothetical protein
MYVCMYVERERERERERMCAYVQVGVVERGGAAAVQRHHKEDRGGE